MTVITFCILFLLVSVNLAAADGPAVKATDFQTQKVYQSKQRPSNTAWANLFPGENGKWYLSFREVTNGNSAMPRMSRQQWYEMGMPVGYERTKHKDEMVLMESTDGLKTWKELWREELPWSWIWRTKGGEFLRFDWACYSADPKVKPNEIMYTSSDSGKTWKKQPAFHDSHFVSYPYHIRPLHDGTLVLTLPLAHKWGEGTDYPTRISTNLQALNDMQMNICFSFDQGKTWTSPLPIYGGQTVSETDFVELPDGNLLFINNSIFATPGRQFVYRQGNRFTPGPLERVHSGRVPETVCLTDDGILVGCMRPGDYYWSDDLGQNWQPLEGAAGNGEVYQPWMYYLGNGRVVCAGHYGADDPIGGVDQYMAIQTFKIQMNRKTKDTKLRIDRDYDAVKNRYLNSYAITLTSDGKPIADKDISVWYVDRDTPGYDSYNSSPIENRMKMGGKTVKVKTDENGIAHLSLPEFDGTTSIHRSYQMFVSFNSDRSDTDYKPAQLPQLEYYALSYQEP